MLQTASFMGILRTILIILVVYYLFKIVAKMAAPFIMSYMSKKMGDKFGGQSPFNQRPNTTADRNVGETVIDKVPDKNANTNNEVGEYIDYEEVE
ncbi:protein of unknown function [Flavobacteriaceae bacterium MAR_2010_188]|nr:protein of unknown function [Flavobacteriaceae bacterium MAR_2010_188]